MLEIMGFVVQEVVLTTTGHRAIVDVVFDTSLEQGVITVPCAVDANPDGEAVLARRVTTGWYLNIWNDESASDRLHLSLNANVGIKVR